VRPLFLLLLVSGCASTPSQLLRHRPDSCAPQQSVKANGVDLEYDVTGPEDGKPLLLIMGLGAQMHLWSDELVQLLVAQGFRVIRFDNRDVGRSTHFTDAGRPSNFQLVKAKLFNSVPPYAYRVTDMADDAAALLEALGIKQAHVMGVSMGGMIAQQLAIQHPARVLSLVSIMSTTGGRDLPPADDEVIDALLRAEPATSPDQAAERGVKLVGLISSPAWPADPSKVAESSRKSFERCYDPDGVLRQFVAIWATPDRRAALRELKVPTLVVHGKSDRLVKVQGGIDTALHVRDADLMLIDGMGHDLPRPLWPRLAEAVARNAARAQRAVEQ
jgi:pimeloyl-ACP methyl ester carboxylesterase